MNLLEVSCRCWLPALAAAALWGSSSNDVLARDAPAQQPPSAATRTELPKASPAQQDAPGSEKREANEAEKRERRAAEERETSEASERRAAEGGVHELETEYRKLTETRRRLEGELRSLGDGEAAQKLKQRLAEIQERMEVIRRVVSGRAPERAETDAEARERRELEERASELRRKLGQLKDGRNAEARELYAALIQIQQKLRGLEPQRRDVEGQREKAHEQSEEAARAYERARQAFRDEDAEQIRRRRAELAGRDAREIAIRPPLAGSMQIREELKELGDIVRELRTEVRQLRGQIEEMRKTLKEIAERSQDDKKEKNPQ